MALVNLVAGEVLALEARGLVNNQQFINRIHVYMKAKIPTPGAPVASTSRDYLTLFRTKWRTQILPLLLNTYFVREYWVGRVKNVTLPTPNNPVAEYDEQTLYLGESGTDEGGIIPGVETLPGFIAMNVRKIAEPLSKYGRGSMRIGPWAEADQTNGIFANAIVAAINLAMITFQADWIPGGVDTDPYGKVCVFSEKKAGLNPPLIGGQYAFACTDIALFAAQRIVSSQVSRKTSPAGY